MGTIYATAGKFKEATDEAVFVLDRNPQDAEAPLLLVESAQTEPACQAAQQRLQKLASSGDRASFEVALGTLAFREHDAKTAEADFKKALTLDAKSAAAFEALGSLYASQNDLTNAETNLKSAADLLAGPVAEAVALRPFQARDRRQRGRAADPRGHDQANAGLSPGPDGTGGNVAGRKKIR